MQNDLDHFDAYYADRLWLLMPEVYRAADSGDPDLKGPLRELCERIGAQMAIVRRGIDRMWDDQSIETSDDWVVPYLGELLATNLVSGLDPRGQRRQVANTIYYRRRKGTMAILEQIAHDVTGWDARVVEFFRRLARTRHGLDPEIGLPSATADPDGNRALQFTAGLVGRLTGTTIGGTADLHNIYGASKSGTPFDELFYTPDVRRGEGMRGWYNIPRLGVFLWRLYAFPQTAGNPDELLVTPVAGAAPCTNHYTFDPTGRQVPLFVSSVERGHAEWQLPSPITTPLLEDPEATLYSAAGSGAITMHSLGVFREHTTDLVARGDVRIWPEIGRFSVAAANPGLRVWYHYGFSSRIGAGAYDRRPLGMLAPAPAPERRVVGGAAVTTIPATGTITLTDSSTYVAVHDVPVVKNLILRSANGRRPLVRPSVRRAPWTFTGAANGNLRLEGMFVSGADVVLRGTFDEVTIACSTLDPGEAADPGAPEPFATAFDGRALRPTTLWIEGKVRALTIDRSITGPIRTRGDGSVEELTIRDTIVQLVAAPPSAALDVKDQTAFLTLIRKASDPLSRSLRDALKLTVPDALAALAALGPADPIPPALANDIVAGINELLANPALLPPPSRRTIIVRSHDDITDQAARNRALLEDAYPLELGDFAIALTSGEVRLTHVTVLGPMYVHRIDASESILGDYAWAEDPQHGCVRFSAWVPDSILPRKYESVRVAAGAALFNSRSFANPAHAQLRSDADRMVIAEANARNSIRDGAEDGAEMGAFHAEMGAIKERSLLIKFDEFMPLGLIPVIVHVT